MMPISASTAAKKYCRLQALGGAYLGLFAGLLITFGVWRWSEHNFALNEQAYFDFRVGQLLASIDTRLEAYRQVLYGTRGLFAASSVVARAEFQEYVNALHLEQRYPGIQGVGFSLIVPKDKKDVHIKEIRRQGFADYRIYPDQDREIYTSIIYLEPFSGRNLRAFGYDMFTEPVRRRAMEYACKHNQIGMSGKVTLVQETDSDVQAGFLLYLPVYRNNQPHDSVDERKASVIGWVYAPFRIKDFVSGVGDERRGDLNLSIYDGETLSAGSLMYSDQPQLTTDQAIVTTRTLRTGGQVWTLVIRSEPGFGNWLNHDQSLTILISGMALSVMLAFLIREFITRGQALAFAAATNRELQESEARFRLMADSAPVLIWMTDAAESVVWLNKHWLDFTGRELSQELGRGWLESVYPSHLDLVVKLLGWHFQLRKPFSVEYRLRRHDGEYRWIVNSGVPRFDQKGEFVGFIGSCIDITSHKEMEEELWELATTDGLTGFLNRRHFLVRLQEEFNRMQRNDDLHSSVLMLDLDHFKRINDSYGHATGDAMLKHFAEIIRGQQRKIDVVGRLGGEEFAIILPDTDIYEARVFAERLRNVVASKPLWQQDTMIEITVSIGIALLNYASLSPDSVLGAADRALYRAKADGRNRVALAGK